MEIITIKPYQIQHLHKIIFEWHKMLFVEIQINRDVSGSYCTMGSKFEFFEAPSLSTTRVIPPLPYDFCYRNLQIFMEARRNIKPFCI